MGDPAGYVIVLVNLVLGFACALPLAKMLARVRGSRRILRYFAVLIGVYLTECVAFSCGMATNIFSVALAFVWGAALGLWLRRSSASAREVFRTTLFFSLYSSMPALSFLSVLVLLFFSEWPILTVEGGARFGIPHFVPWPVNTLMGFFLSVSCSAVVLKALITTGEVALFIRSRKPGVRGDPPSTTY
jgi:hypothetical protein